MVVPLVAMDAKVPARPGAFNQGRRGTITPTVTIAAGPGIHGASKHMRFAKLARARAMTTLAVPLIHID